MDTDTLASSFADVQRRRLVEAWQAEEPGATTPHVLIGLPSYSVERSVYEHYGDRVPALENRFAYCMLSARHPHTRVAFLSSLPLAGEILEGYVGLLDDRHRPAIAERARAVTPEDKSARSLAEKLLDRGDLIDGLRAFIDGEPALIEAWNVTDAEAALAVALDAPIHGTEPRLRALATKSNGRRLLRDAGVPVPPGVEDVRTPADVAAAIAGLARRNPALTAVVVKLDDSVAGDGNVVLPATAVDQAAVEALLPAWYLPALKAGGVVEERIQGADFRSPSAQATITPTGEVRVLATHEQRLGGPDNQVYEGCTFPADAEYAARLAEHVRQAGRGLAEQGACGRYAVDFVVCRNGAGDWDVFALEINLRKGGTTHPYGIMRILTGGSYDAPKAAFHDRHGQPIVYGATDNLVDVGWVGRPPADVRHAVSRHGLAYDRATGEGVVLHLLDCLAIDGRMGYTAIAHTQVRQAELEERLLAALHA